MISVLLPAFNGENYIAEQIASILDCLGSSDELIIADDASVDGTNLVIKQFNDSRIKLICRHKNIGLKRSISELVSLAQGRYIFFADQDDIWLKDRISATLPLLEEYELVVSDCLVVTSDLRILESSYFSVIRPNKRVLQNILSCKFLGCCMAMRAETAKNCFPLNVFAPAHDWWFGVLCLLLNKKIFFFEDPALLYRRHTSNVSMAAGISNRPFLRKILDRFFLVVSLIITLIRITILARLGR